MVYREEKSIVKEERANLASSIRHLFSQKPVFNLMILESTSPEWKYYYQTLDQFVLLEINKVSSLRKFLDSGIKLCYSENPDHEILDMDNILSRKNGKFKCLLYPCEDVLLFEEFVYYYLLGNGFFCIDYLIDNQKLLVIYSDINEPRHHEMNYFFIVGGIGDFFIILPILYQIQTKLKYKIVIRSKGLYEVLCTLGFSKNVEIIYINHYIGLLSNEKYILFTNMHAGIKYAKMLDEKSCFEVSCDYYKKINMIPDLSYTSIFDNFKKKFPYKWIGGGHAKPKVAVQRISSKMEGSVNIKEWPKEEMRELIKYCRMNDIELINVCPHDDMRNEYPFDEAGRSLLSLFELLCKVDLFIGVDSGIGHMCALTGTPGLNLYFSYQNTLKYIHNKLMPLSMSYTLFSPLGYPKCSSVIKEMNTILEGKRQLSKTFVPYSERKQKLHYDIV